MNGVYDIKTNNLEIDKNSLDGEGKFHTVEVDNSLYTNGYILNLCLKCKEYNESNDYYVIKKIVNDNPDSLQHSLYGCYTIVIISDNNDCYIYNDLLSKMSLYYCVLDDKIIFSNSLYQCAESAKKNGANLTIDYLALRMMKKHSIVFDDLTYFKEIKFLKPFQYICIKNNRINICELKIPDTKLDMTEDFAIEECHRLFSEGILCSNTFNKEHCYKQVSTLSGGMDSRTVYLYGEKSSMVSDIIYNYSEESSMDYQIALKIAEKDKKVFFYHSLSHGQFLLNRDEMARRVEGQFYYAGTTGLYESLSMYYLKDWGLVHTGVGGGEIMGDMCVYNEKHGWTNLYNSFVLDDEDIKKIDNLKCKYNSYNQFSNINDIRRCLASQKMAKSFDIEYDSVFLYEPFFIHMLQVPFKFKYRRHLYLKWLNKYCKSKYPSTHRYCSKTFLIYALKKIVYCIVTKIGRKSKYDMNPFEYWEKINPEMLAQLNNIFNSDILKINNYVNKEFLDSIQKEWESCSLKDKATILTITWSINEMINRKLI